MNSASGQPSKDRREVKYTPPGECKAFNLMGIRIAPKVVSEDTNGAYCLIEQTVPPGAGSPPHICHRDDKTIYVMQGEFAILAGSQTLRATPGTCVHIPRGTIHNFRNSGSADGKLLVTLTPAGHERFLEEMSRLSQGGPPDPAKLAELCESRGVELLRR